MPATPPDPPEPDTRKLTPTRQELAPEDFYMEGPYMVFTAAYHIKRGYCCHSGCRHCPWQNPLDLKP